jgi:hypothetical protein
MGQPTGSYRRVLDIVSFTLFGLAEASWAFAVWNPHKWPDLMLDRVETVRITCQVGGAVAGLLAGRFWLSAQVVVGLVSPWVGRALVVVEGVRRLRRVPCPRHCVGMRA